MRVLFDTNVILDLLLEREPFVRQSSDLISRVGFHEIVGGMAATTVTTLCYLCTKALDEGLARQRVRKITSIYEIVPVDSGAIWEAFESPINDFEDAVLVAAARQAGMDAIVTRNKKDFARAAIPVHTPQELLAMIDADE